MKTEEIEIRTANNKSIKKGEFESNKKDLKYTEISFDRSQNNEEIMYDEDEIFFEMENKKKKKKKEEINLF